MKNSCKGQRPSLRNKYLSLIILLLFSSLAFGQARITYTPMAQAGYQWKYDKADSGRAVPFRDLSLGRGTTRPGSIVCNTADSVLYYWNGVIWVKLASATGGGGTFIGIDSVTYYSNNICQWKAGVPTCYPVIPGVDSVVVTGDQLCQWKAGIATCYTINGNVLGTFLDSVTVAGDQLCQWKAGVSTCYTINNTSTGLDSLTVEQDQDSIRICGWSQGVSTCFKLRKDTVDVLDDLYVVTDPITGHQQIGHYHADGLVSGGVVTKAGCWTVDVSALSAYFHYTLFNIPQNLGIVIDTAHPSLPRIDIVVVDSFGIVRIKKGIPNINPVPPSLNVGYEIQLAQIRIDAGASCLPISVINIYNENLGSPSEYIATSSGIANFNNTDNPQDLIKAAFVPSYTNGSTMTFTKGAGVDSVTNSSILKAWVYLNGAIFNLSNWFQLQFWNDTVAVSNKVQLNTGYGLNPGDSNHYQLVSPPLSVFTFNSPYYNKLVVTMGGYDTSGVKGFYADHIQIQSGIINTIPDKRYVDSTKIIAGVEYYYVAGIPYSAGSVGSGGTVGTVTGTAPIVITGTPTTTPNVTITQATTSTNGYLTSTNWNTFNNKIDSVTKNTTFDSVYVWKNGTHTTYRDSVGGTATPTWDQTLRKSPYTRQTAIWDDSVAVAGTGIYFTQFKPRNYGTSYTTGTQSLYSQGYNYYPGVNADGRPNVVGSFWGYNGGFGTPVLAGEATWGFRTENWFLAASRKLSEFHLPEFTPINGVTRRPNSMYIDNDNGYTTQTQQIDSYNMFQGATDTLMFAVAPNGAQFGFNQNEALTIINKRVPTNFLSVYVGDAGPVFSIGAGTSPASTIISMGAPVVFGTHPTIGTSFATAMYAIVGTANSSALKIAQSGLGSSDFKGITGDFNTSGTFTAMGFTNSTVGGNTLSTMSSNGGKVQYRLFDGTNSVQWNITAATGTLGHPLYIGVGADSSIKIMQTTKDVYLKYNVAVGTAAPTARLHLPAGTTAASTAPLKFTTASAALLTTPEVGAMEVLVDSLYYTGANGTRNKIFPQSATGSVTSVGTGYGLSGGTITSTGTIIVDSATLSTKYLRIVDTANIRFRPIAGSNITLTGTYPNITIASSGGGGSGITRSISSTAVSAAAGSTAATDYVIYASGATTTITLPTAVGNTNRYTIMRTGTATVIIATTSSQTINGAAAPLNLTVQYASVDLISDGSNWFIH